MRIVLRILAVVLLFTFVAIAIGAFAVHPHDVFDGLTVIVDGQPVFDPDWGAVAGLGLGGAITFAVGAALVVAFGVAALFAVGAVVAVAFLVPVAIIGLLLFVVGAVLFGLLPILVPALLVVGACVLLARLFRRSRRTSTAALPAPTSHA